MKNVNFAIPFKDLRGKDNEGQLMSEFIANLLAMARAEGSAARQIKIATQLIMSTGAIDIEDADMAIIKKVITNATISALAKERIEKIIEGNELAKK